MRYMKIFNAQCQPFYLDHNCLQVWLHLKKSPLVATPITYLDKSPIFLLLWWVFLRANLQQSMAVRRNHAQVITYITR